MFEELKLDRLVRRMKEGFAEFCDVRTGKNKQYDMVDAGIGAFAVFFTQSPSFLAYQTNMKGKKRRSNAESLFEMERLPSDNQIRALLDPVSPESVTGVFRYIYHRLQRAEVLEGFRSHGHNLSVAMAGVVYFPSRKINCKKCR